MSLIEAERTKKPRLHYTLGISPKRETSGGAHLRGIYSPGPEQRKTVVAVTIEKAAGDSVRLTGPESHGRFPTPIAASLTASSKNSQKPIDNKVWERQSCKRANHCCQRAEDVGPDLNPIFKPDPNTNPNLSVSLSPI